VKAFNNMRKKPHEQHEKNLANPKNLLDNGLKNKGGEGEIRNIRRDIPYRGCYRDRRYDLNGKWPDHPGRANAYSTPDVARDFFQSLHGKDRFAS
jgi:hypothetical protein